jgi:hypothetical protein
MNRPFFTLALAGSLCAGVAQAQSDASVTQPTSPAPAVVSTATPNGPAPTVVQASSANTAPTSVTQIVYTPQLPSAADLTNAASAQGLTVERIVQTSNQVIAFYRNANGQTSNVAYQSLPPAGAPAATTPNVVVTSPPPTVVTSPPPSVIYETAPRVVYYDYPSYYYPRVWYPPVSFSFGLGYHRGYYGGSRGGYRHR